jgi:hypothetical protein
MRIQVVDHPLVAHKLTKLRDERTDSATFRNLADELVTLLAYEATRDVRVEPGRHLGETAAIGHLLCKAPDWGVTGELAAVVPHRDTDDLQPGVLALRFEPTFATGVAFAIDMQNLVTALGQRSAQVGLERMAREVVDHDATRARTSAARVTFCCPSDRASPIRHCCLDPHVTCPPPRTVGSEDHRSRMQ